MSTYSESAFPAADDIELEFEDDLPRGPRTGTLSQRSRFGIALVLAVGLAVGAATTAFNLGKATTSTPAAKIDVAKQIAGARAAALAQGEKTGYAKGLADGQVKGANATALTSFNRGFARGKKRGIAQGLRDGRRRGYSDGVDSATSRYQASITALTTALQKANKDLVAAQKKSAAAKGGTSTTP